MKQRHRFWTVLGVVGLLAGLGGYVVGIPGLGSRPTSDDGAKHAAVRQLPATTGAASAGQSPQASSASAPGVGGPGVLLSLPPTAPDQSGQGSRQAQYDSLAAKTPRQLWTSWDAAAARMEPGEMSLLGHALAASLRSSGDEGVYRVMGDRLFDRARSVKDRVAVADTLGIAATPAAVQQLRRFLQSSGAWTGQTESTDSPEAVVTEFALRAVTEASRTSLDGGRNWAVSQPIEDAWKSLGSGASAALLRTVAEALAYVGKPSGVEALIDSAHTAESGEAKAKVARSVIEGLHANEPVAVLAAALQKQPQDAGVSRSIVRGLISIGSADAILELTRYLDAKSDTDKAWLAEVEARLVQRQLPPEAKKVLAFWGKGK